MVQTIQPQALALVILFPAMSTLMVGLRTWSRYLMKQFYWDDALVLLAWALAVAYAGVCYKWIKVEHFGYHVWDLPKPSVHTEILAQQLNMAQQLLYNPVLCIVKASVIIFLLRLGDLRRRVRWPLLALFWFNLGHMISVFFAALTQCLPIHMYWDHYKTDRVVNGQVVNPHYHCFEEEDFSLTTAGLAIFTDVLILCIPIVMMWNLRMPLGSKFAVGIVLSLGWTVTAVSIVRFKIFYDYWQGDNPDPTYSLGTTISGIETNVAIITSCGPAMKALITHFWPKFFGGSHDVHSGDVYYSSGGYEMNSRTAWKSATRSTHSHIDPSGSTAEIGERGGVANSQEVITSYDSHKAIKSGLGNDSLVVENMPSSAKG